MEEVRRFYTRSDEGEFFTVIEYKDETGKSIYREEEDDLPVEYVKMEQFKIIVPVGLSVVVNVEGQSDPDYKLEW